MDCQCRFEAFYVEQYCACGDMFKYTFATREGFNQQRVEWAKKHRGFGHHPITNIKWKQLWKQQAERLDEEAKAKEGLFPFMADDSSKQ